MELLREFLAYNKIMQKLFQSIFVLGCFFLSGCGPAQLTATLVNGEDLNLELNAQNINYQRDWQPAQLVVGSKGFVYFSDTANHRILKVSPQGHIETFAGQGLQGSTNQTLLKSQFFHPRGLTFDEEGHLWVADSGNHAIRKLSASGQVSTHFKDTFAFPHFLTHLPGFGLYGVGLAPVIYRLTDERAEEVVRLSTPHEITSLTHLGNTLYFTTQRGLWRWSQGELKQLVSFSGVRKIGGLFMSPNGDAWFSDVYQHKLYRYETLTGVFEELTRGEYGYRDGPLHEVRFAYPGALTQTPNGDLVVADQQNKALRLLEQSRVRTLVRNGEQGFGQSPGNNEMKFPHGVVIHPKTKEIIVCDYIHNRLLKIDGQNKVRVYFEPSNTPKLPLNLPAGLAFGPDQSLYVSSSGGHRIHKITPAGNMVLLAGNGKPGLINGGGKQAQFRLPFGLAVDIQHNVYVADQGNHVIRKIDSRGRVSTLTGTGQAGFSDGPFGSAQFNRPSGLALDKSGHLLVADSFNHRIRQVNLNTGQVTTLAGTGVAGLNDGRRDRAQFYVPEGLALDPRGNLFVTDRWNHRIRKVARSGQVSTVVGKGKWLAFGGGFAEGDIKDSRFHEPKALAVDVEGNLIVADTGNHRIRKVDQ